MRVVLQPFSTTRLSDTLLSALDGKYSQFHSFQAAVAFAKLSGVQFLEKSLRHFGERGGDIRMVVGIDQFVTSSEALAKLLDSVGSNGQIWINHDSRPYITFHPKLYLFEGDADALLIIGSGNLTQGGIQTNDEASSVNVLDLNNSDDKAVLNEVKSALDGWCNGAEQNVKRLDADLLQTLIRVELIKSEAQLRIEIPDMAETAVVR
jgi:HKD family nuclease